MITGILIGAAVTWFLMKLRRGLERPVPRCQQCGQVCAKFYPFDDDFVCEPCWRLHEPHGIDELRELGMVE